MEDPSKEENPQDGIVITTEQILSMVRSVQTTRADSSGKMIRIVHPKDSHVEDNVITFVDVKIPCTPLGSDALKTAICNILFALITEAALIKQPQEATAAEKEE